MKSLMSILSYLFVAVVFAQSYECVNTLERGGSPIESIFIKGNLMYTGNFDGDIDVWLLPDGEWKYSQQAHKNRVNTIDQDASGTYLLTASSDWSVKVWRGKELMKSYITESNVSFALFSRDGQRIYYGCHDGLLYCAEWKTDKAPYVVYSGNYFITSGCMIREKDLLLFSSGYTTKLFGVRKQKLIDESPNCSDFVNQLAYDGKDIFAWCENGTLNRYSFRDGFLVLIEQIYSGEKGYSKIGISSLQKEIVTGNASGRANVWDLNTMQKKESIEAHGQTIKQALYYDRGAMLITTAYDGLIKFWKQKDPPVLAANESSKSGSSFVQEKEVSAQKAKSVQSRQERNSDKIKNTANLSSNKVQKPSVKSSSNKELITNTVTKKEVKLKEQPKAKSKPQVKTTPTTVIKKEVKIKPKEQPKGKPKPQVKTTPTIVPKKENGKKPLSVKKPVSQKKAESVQSDNELDWLIEAIELEEAKPIDRRQISNKDLAFLLKDLDSLGVQGINTNLVYETVMDLEDGGRDLDIQHTILVMDKDIVLSVWDHQKEDGDIISLYLNNELILNNHLLTKSKKYVRLRLKGNAMNELKLYAENLGRVAPNTASLEIKHMDKTYNLVLRSDLHKCGVLEIKHQNP